MMSSELTQSGALSDALELQPADRVKLRRRNRLEPWLFILPALLFQLCWGWYPVLFGIIISFTDAQPIGPSQFVGLDNYVRMFNDPLTRKAFVVTFKYAILTIGLTFVIPILVAILLMEMRPRVMRWMMLLWFLPLSPIAGAILWRYLYNSNYGVFEYVMTSVFHLPPQPILNDPNQVLLWLVLPGVLLFGPGLIYMAALQGIPRSYFEAAEVEGAGFWRKIWTITLPRLRPVISVLLTFGIIGTLQEYSWPALMTNGEPGGESRTIVMYMYNLLGYDRFADAIAVAALLFFVTLIITVVFRTFYKEDPDV